MCSSIKGKIFNIQRFSTLDGPGIRTVVFLKGCPLDCIWCHNPESKHTNTELFYKQEMCIGCGACEKVCEKSLHTFENGIHQFEREKCILCGKCAEVCCTRALERCGEEKSVKEVLELVEKDNSIYEQSEGGVTLSGGEPLFQYDFSLALLKGAKEKGIHTAVETSGYTVRDLQEMHAYTDLWLYDIKVFPEELHKKCTGVSNRTILDNLHFLDSLGAKIILRCPIIPDINMSALHFEEIAKLASKLQNVIEIDLEPYHPLGISKAKQLNKTQVYDNEEFLNASEIKRLADELQNKVDVKVIIL